MEFKNGGRNLSVCVFCASGEHLPEIYRVKTIELGREMAKRKIKLVYGGGNNGLMGLLAKEIHKNGGIVSGIITEKFKEMGFAYEDADEMAVTETMRERKALMEMVSDAFIALPGGYGTLEETLEILTLNQLEIISKPVVFLNINSYFDPILSQFDKAHAENFIDKKHCDLLFATMDIDKALDYILEKTALISGVSMLS